VQEQWSMRSAKEEHRHAGCESTLPETAGGRYNSTNKNSQKKKIEKRKRDRTKESFRP